MRGPAVRSPEQHQGGPVDSHESVAGPHAFTQERHADLRRRLLRLISEKGYEWREDPFQLSSGEWSHDYIDGKRAFAAGNDLRLVAECVVSLADAEAVEFEAVGGLTMGADALAHAISVLTGKRWFAVRKEPKRHGKQKLIEGAELRPRERVLVVDDVVTTGKSITRALDAIRQTGASVVLAVAIVDRGEVSRQRLESQGIPYQPVLTFEDLGIAPIHG